LPFRSGWTGLLAAELAGNPGLRLEDEISLAGDPEALVLDSLKNGIIGLGEAKQGSRMRTILKMNFICNIVARQRPRALCAASRPCVISAVRRAYPASAGEVLFSYLGAAALCGS
jgi:hypothetical protein